MVFLSFNLTFLLIYITLLLTKNLIYILKSFDIIVNHFSTFYGLLKIKIAITQINYSLKMFFEV